MQGVLHSRTEGDFPSDYDVRCWVYREYTREEASGRLKQGAENGLRRVLVCSQHSIARGRPSITDFVKDLEDYDEADVTIIDVLE